MKPIKITITITPGGGNPPGVGGMAPACSRTWLRPAVQVDGVERDLGDEHGAVNGWIGAHPRSTQEVLRNLADALGILVAYTQYGAEPIPPSAIMALLTGEGGVSRGRDPVLEQALGAIEEAIDHLQHAGGDAQHFCDTDLQDAWEALRAKLGGKAPDIVAEG